jgi:GAF domain-containing protein
MMHDNEIEKAYQNIQILSEIGQQITSTLDFETIFLKLHEGVNRLMDAESFGLRIYRPETNDVDVRYGFDRGKRITPFTFSMDDDNNFSVWCIKNKKEIFINDNLTEHKKYVKEIVIIRGDMTHSLIFCPMIINDKVIGVLTAQSHKKNQYTSHHLDIMRTLASYAAIALENARIYERLEEKVKERTQEVVVQQKELEKSFQNIKLLSEIGQQITATLSVEEIIEKAYKNVNTLMDASVFGIGIYNEEKKELQFNGVMEKGEKMPSNSESIEDIDRPSVWSFVHSKELIMNDWVVDYEKYFSKAIDVIVGDESESLIYLPLSIQGKKIGVLTVQSFEKHAYSDHHLDILRNLAVYIATAIENARLYESMETEVKERTNETIRQKEDLEISYQNISILSEIGQQITSTHDFETIFEKLGECVNRLMDAENFGVRIYHPEKNEVEVKYEFDRGERLKPFSFSMDDDNNYSVWCIKNRKEIFINDNLTENKNYVKKMVVIRGDITHSLIFCPMIINDKVIGVITAQSYQKNQYTAHHLNVLKTLASYAAIALENARLYENMDAEVKQRTDEVTLQKEELEKSFQSVNILSEIGKQITSSLSVEKIIETAYENINQLMDASSFWIGIHNPVLERLDYPLGKEKGQTLPFAYYELTEDERLPVWAFKNQKEVFVNDYLTDYYNYIPGGTPPRPVVGDMPESSIWFPLISKERNTLGIITIQSFEKNMYTDYHLSIVRSLAVFTSIALENALLYEQVEQKVKERTAEVVKQKEEIELSYANIQLLSEIGQQITAMLSVETIMEKVYENINKLMDASAFCLGLYNQENNSLEFRGDIENGERLPFAAEYLDDNTRSSIWCFNNQKEIFINDIRKEYSIYFPDIPIPIPTTGEQTESIMYVPLTVQDKKIGVISVQSFSKNAYSDYHLGILRNLAVYAAIALENAQLYQNTEEEVKKRTLVVTRQNEELEIVYKHVTDSIKYAKRIQEAVLPPDSLVKRLLPDSFILYKPKDIVSGDFYWVDQKDGRTMFAAVDCTGHGVPGAFMSIVGYNILKQAVNNNNFSTPSLILDALNEGVSETLHHGNTDSHAKDGMDLSFCTIDYKKLELEYAGAFNPLYIIRNGTLIQVKANKFPIGYFLGEEKKKFTNHVIQLQKGDCVYICTDGYADQFGGPNGKKFMANNFRELLINVHALPAEEQHKILDNTIEDWRGMLDQVDDILVIGVKI